MAAWPPSATCCFQDDDLKELYDPGNGRPSLPPSILSGVLLLQFHDDVSDEEAVQRLQFDLRWQVALNLPTDYPGFDPTSLGNFRERLAEHGQERYAFDRFVAVGRAAGFIPDRVTLLTDTTRTKGAGAVQDTYTLLRKCMRKLLKQLGYAAAGKRRGLAPETERLLATYLEQDRKAKIDWSDPDERAKQLKVLFQDAEAVLDLAAEHSDDAEVRATGWLLVKIMGDDIERDAHGNPQIAQGTAPDRIISITDPEMRHGRKSKAQRFDGFKVSVTTEQSSETDRGHPGHPGGRQRRPGADAHHRAGRTACSASPSSRSSATAPMARARTGRPAPTSTSTCWPRSCSRQTRPWTSRPSRSTWSSRRPPARKGRRWQASQDRARASRRCDFTFARATCEACPLFQRCVKSKRRADGVHASVRNVPACGPSAPADRRVQGTLPAAQRRRAQAGRTGAARHPRDPLPRPPETAVAALWTAAVVNLKRLFRLCEMRNQDLHALLAALQQPPLQPEAA